MAENAAKLKTLGLSLKRIETFSDKITSETEVEQLEVRLESLTNIWTQYKAIHPIGTDEEIEAFLTSEDIYHNTKSILLRNIKKFSPISSQPLNITHNQSSFQRSQSDIKLPRIHIEPFAGDYHQWHSFGDLFLASIDANDTLSNAQKLQYLKGFLKGDALNLIRHIPTTDATYAEAWEKLSRRYGRKKNVVTSLIQNFLELPTVTSNSISKLRDLSNGSDEVVRTLKALGSGAEQRDPWLIQILLGKLDVTTRQKWAEKTVDIEFNTIQEFLEFLNQRCDTLESSSLTTSKASSDKPALKTLHSTAQPIRKNYNDNTVIQCEVCSNKGHRANKCSEFVKKSIPDRRQFVAKANLCFNCLRSNHQATSCTSSNVCRVCSRKHHTLLHLENTTTTSQPSSSIKSIFNTPASTSNVIPFRPSESIHHTVSTPPSESSFTKPQHNSTLNSLFAANTHMSILPTALIKVRDSDNNWQQARALLDSGSQATFITERCVQRLKLQRSHANVSVNGLSSTQAGTTRGQVSLHLSSHHDNNQHINCNAYVLPKVTSNLPSVAIDIEHWTHIRDIPLADPQFNRPGEIDILLGVDVFFDIMRCNVIKVQNKPIAQDTIFGWIIAGQLAPNTNATTAINSFTTSIQQDDQHFNMQRFWEVEEIPILNNQLEDDCEEFYQRTLQTEADGTYVVQLPFKPASYTLGESRSHAMTRFMNLERKFKHNPNLRTDYNEFLQEYLQLHHMEKIPPNEIECPEFECYYLPHHAVIKESSSTTKTRVVFDASARTSTGVSLNDTLLVGPTIQDDLATILIRFRSHKIAFSADVEKMYRQVRVNNNHTNYQRILWRQSSEEPVQDYRLLTVTYGISSAPYLAIKSLHQAATDYGNDHPEAASIIRSDFYVDDLLTGADNVEEALRLQQQITKILQRGQFTLRKWSSNSSEFIKAVTNTPQSKLSTLELDQQSTVKTLGLHWHPIEDVFHFKVFISNQDSLMTKRKLLSEASRLFDPLGFLSPTIIMIKKLFQGLWLSQPNMSWNDTIPEHITQQWVTLRSQLHHLEDVKIPRFLSYDSNADSIELVAFADASTTAYASIVYMRCVHNTNTTVRIVAAKSRVAPIKQLSLPRLELCAALLLTKLVTFVKAALKLPTIKVTAWSDSRIVLDWLNDHPCKWNTFVGNRTSKILLVIPRKDWRHVRSKDNPADCSTRGVLPRNLANLHLWWYGPPWLAEHVDSWPKTSTTTTSEAVQEERHNQTQQYHTHLEVATNPHPLAKLCIRFASFTKLLRILCYVNRFIYNCKHSNNKRHDALSVDELHYAEKNYIRWAQQDEFKDDIKSIIDNDGKCTNKSKLKALSPFIDVDGIVRVGGRLQHADLAYNVKHPMVLPKHHPISECIMRDTHISQLHAGPSLLISSIRQRYWIIGCRNMAKQCIRKCVVCVRHRSARTQQLMGSLPRERVTGGRTFYTTGVDYAGPITLRIHKGPGRLSTTKGYIALFICFASKAVHLELVSDLTTEAFIASLKRFIARRGAPAEIWSDNGKNFIGADSHVRTYANLTNNNVCDFLAHKGTAFKFNPPSAPHFGGIWESNIKSVKHHLKRVTSNTTCTFEEMYTLLTQIEAVLNSRPLCPVTDDPSSLDVLTPSHFLIGDVITAMPEPNLLNNSTNRLNRCQNIQSRLQSFWKCWSQTYLTNLQTRSKWQHQHNNIKEGMLVLIRDENLPPTRWSMRRVTALHPGADGLVRVVTLRTVNGQYKRPIVKLVILPVTA